MKKKLEKLPQNIISPLVQSPSPTSPQVTQHDIELQGDSKKRKSEELLDLDLRSLQIPYQRENLITYFVTQLQSLGRPISFLDTKYLAKMVKYATQLELTEPGWVMLSWFSSILDAIYYVAGLSWHISFNYPDLTHCELSEPMWLIQGFATDLEVRNELLRHCNIPIGAFIIRFSMKNQSNLVMCAKISPTEVDYWFCSHSCTGENGEIQVEGKRATFYAPDLVSAILQHPNTDYLYHKGKCYSKIELFGQNQGYMPPSKL